MAKSANVTSLDAMRHFRQALARFVEDATNALTALHMEVYRALEWLEHDRPHYWRNEVRRCYEQLAQARAELEKAKMKEVAGHRPSCYDEKKALELAKQRLRRAEEKVELVKRWAILVRDEMNEYRGRLGALERCLETEIPRTIAMLDRSIAALESYVEVQTPEPLDVDSGSAESP